VAFFLSFMVKISLTGVQSSYGAAAATASAVHAIKGRDPWIAPKTPYIAPLGRSSPAKGRILCHLKNVSYLQDCSTVSAAPLMLRAIRKPSVDPGRNQGAALRALFFGADVLVQDQALRAANDRLQELEGKVKDLESQAASGPRSGGFLSGLGSCLVVAPAAARARAAAGQPLEPTAAAAARWLATAPARLRSAGTCQGHGAARVQAWWRVFDGSARHAAGVAGGVLLADFRFRGLFSGHNNSLGIGTGFGGVAQAWRGLGGDTIVNNYYGDGQSLSQQDAAQDAQQDAADDAQQNADYSKMPTKIRTTSRRLGLWSTVSAPAMTEATTSEYRLVAQAWPESFRPFRKWPLAAAHCLSREMRPQDGRSRTRSSTH